MAAESTRKRKYDGIPTSGGETEISVEKLCEERWRGATQVIDRLNRAQLLVHLQHKHTYFASFKLKGTFSKSGNAGGGGGAWEDHTYTWLEQLVQEKRYYPFVQFQKKYVHVGLKSLNMFVKQVWKHSMLLFR
jgi:hypothetical protein